MLFIMLLVAATVAIAGSAAYFSVYGLAATFSGVFWSVVVMGASLEAGKLVAASYLYRYWDKTNLALKSYLMAGIAALMVLTSLGIFGYLSSGYQQDVLPLKQKTEQITLLEDEKARALARKKQIDDLMAGGPAVGNVNKKNGDIDANAARVLRETTRSRDQLVRQYRAEQESVTKRVAELDAQLLTLKQEVIKTEAHIGPITYVAKAFGLSTDDATKYLVFVIIFAFDPMAVALTLAVNIALRIRREEREAAERAEEAELLGLAALPEPVEAFVPEQPAPVKRGIEDQRGSLDEIGDGEPVAYAPKTVIEDQRGSLDDVGEAEQQPLIKLGLDEPRGSLENVGDVTPEAVNKVAVEEPRGSLDDVADVQQEQVAKIGVEEPRGSLDDIDVPPVEEEPREEAPLAFEQLPSTTDELEAEQARRRFRPYPGTQWMGDGDTPSDKLRRLINEHKYLKARRDNGETLTKDETWQMGAIEEVLRKNGVDMYL